jgi:hypothetical protein
MMFIIGPSFALASRVGINVKAIRSMKESIAQLFMSVFVWNVTDFAVGTLVRFH